MEDPVPEILQFKNGAIEQLATVISSNSLFSSFETYAVVVPALRANQLLPDPLQALQTLFEGQSFSSDNQWEIWVHAHLRLGSSLMRRGLWAEDTKIIEQIPLLDFVDVHRRQTQILSDEMIALIKVWETSGFKLDPHINDLSAGGASQDDLWGLDLKLLLMSDRQLPIDALKGILHKAIKHDKIAHVTLIFLELLDSQQGRVIRSNLGAILQYAIPKDNTYILGLLLLCSLKPVNKHENIGSALIVAAKGAHKTALQLLLRHGIGVDTRSADGNFALLAAISSGHKDTVELLLKHGANPDPPAVTGQSTPLAITAENQRPTILRMLIDASAPANQPGRTQGTPLQLAAARGLLENVKVLVEAGADMHYPAVRNGQTALQAAVGSGNPTCVDYLVQQGCHVNEYPVLEGFASLQIVCRLPYGLRRQVVMLQW
jgi:ankyrin repeat protein